MIIPVMIMLLAYTMVSSILYLLSVIIIYILMVKHYVINIPTL